MSPAQFLAHLTPRQIQIAAMHLDGATQCEIAEAHQIDHSTVSRDLAAVRETCQRFGKELPAPLRVHAARKVQLRERAWQAMGIN